MKEKSNASKKKHQQKELLSRSLLETLISASSKFRNEEPTFERWSEHSMGTGNLSSLEDVSSSTVAGKKYQQRTYIKNDSQLEIQTKPRNYYNLGDRSPKGSENLEGGTYLRLTTKDQARVPKSYRLWRDLEKNLSQGLNPLRLSIQGTRDVNW
ncbi:hypothetical protein ACH5RR_001243 [Cinchona calisaya]|uniref:Uncharacterized protein n=1 Tax=Cinchona calisaya TaxID=153742 RepID=A0ABD3B2U4_9GENT